MRLRIIVHRFRPEVGGTELMAEEMARGMVRRGFEVEVVTLRPPGAPAEEYFRADGNSIARVYRTVRLEHLGERFRLPVGYWRWLEPAGDAVQGADLIHLFGNRIWCTDWFLPVAGRVRLPKVLTGQNFYQLWMHPNAINTFYFQRYFPRAVERVDCFVAQTFQESEQLRAFGYRGRLELIPHATNVAEIDATPVEEGARFRTAHGIGPEERVALSIGGFIPNKRMDRVVDGVTRSSDPWRLVLIGRDAPGTPYDLTACSARAVARGLRPIVLGADGPIARAEVLAALRASDAYVQGSSYEGYGGALAEAMAAGLPFVAYSTGAVPEFVRAGAGVVASTPEEVGAALDRFARDRIAARSLGANGAAEVRAHRSTEVVMDAYARLFREFGDRAR